MPLKVTCIQASLLLRIHLGITSTCCYAYLISWSNSPDREHCKMCETMEHMSCVRTAFVRERWTMDSFLGSIGRQPLSGGIVLSPCIAWSYNCQASNESVVGVRCMPWAWTSGLLCYVVNIHSLPFPHCHSSLYLHSHSFFHSRLESISSGQPLYISCKLNLSLWFDIGMQRGYLY